MTRSLTATAVAGALSFTFGVAPVAAQAPTASPPDGAALYRQHCRNCHGSRGKPTQRMQGLYPEIKSLADSATMAGLGADSIVTVLVKGMGKDMKPFGEKMTREEMRAVAEYVLTLRGVGGT